MDEIRFEWDEGKNTTNKRKHQISFEEAKTVFYDPNALLIHDPDHSNDEDRFILLGLSRGLKILVVCHCYRRYCQMLWMKKAHPPGTFLRNLFL
jgi:uncharacterized DUF497 family protein